MVHDLQRRISRAVIIALAIVGAPASVYAQTLAAATPPQDSVRAPISKAAPTPQLRTRFVVGLEKQADFEVFSLNNPNRVIIELADTKLKLPARPRGKAIGLIEDFRAGLSAADRTRIVINVTEPVVVSSAQIQKGKNGNKNLLVVEIAPFGLITNSIGSTGNKNKKAKKSSKKQPFAKPTYALGAIGLQPPLPRPALSPGARAQKTFKPVIVIDPGHGGHDTGAKKNGAVEKEVVLAFGKLLREKLEKSGRYRVLMTRETDVFVPLGDRVKFGEKNKANLFIAVHCDYASRAGANGATIYSLRSSTAKSLKNSAKKKVASKVLSSEQVESVKKASGNVDMINQILSDLASRELDATRDRTSVLARSVIKMMGESTKLRSDPDKQAGFRVLKTAQFPSILIELAYVTNEQDAANLQSDTWRNKVSDSILTAVENYFTNQLAQLPM